MHGWMDGWMDGVSKDDDAKYWRAISIQICFITLILSYVRCTEQTASFYEYVAAPKDFDYNH